MKRKFLTLLLSVTSLLLLSHGLFFHGKFYSALNVSAGEYIRSDINKKIDSNKGKVLKNDKRSPLSIISSSTLPSGTVGEKYAYQLRTSKDFLRTVFSIDKKTVFPPGLHLKTNGLVSGVPTTLGTYSFTVRLKNTADNSISKKSFTIKIVTKATAAIQITAQPAVINVQGKEASTHKITYLASTAQKRRISKSKGLSTFTKKIKRAEMVFKSDEGIFEENGKVIERLKSPLKVVLKNNTGKISERLTVPASIAKKIARGKISKEKVSRDNVSKGKAYQLVYRRTFISADSSIKTIAEVIFQKAERKAQGKGKDKKPSYVRGQLVVVTKDSKAGKKLPEHLSKKYHLEILETFSVKALKKRVTVFKTKEKVPNLLNIIKREKGVIQVQTNNLFGTMAEPKSDMQHIARKLNFNKLHKSYRGKGVVVAVIDTGIDVKHRDLKDRVIFSKNFLRGSSYKTEIHGTAVAGIIAASINGFGIEGIAPEAKLIALRACRQISDEHPEGQGDTFSILKALDVAIEKKARIVNMSFGSHAPDRLIREVLREGTKRRILFVAPVGNVSGLEGPTFPASCPYVIAVGGIDHKGNYYPDDALASKARVCAPAVNVFTTVPGNGHNYLNGTSISTAIVSGILAVAVGKNGVVRKKQLPNFKNDICRWTEKILKISICKN